MGPIISVVSNLDAQWPVFSISIVPEINEGTFQDCNQLCDVRGFLELPSGNQTWRLKLTTFNRNIIKPNG